MSYHNCCQCQQQQALQGSMTKDSVFKLFKLSFPKGHYNVLNNTAKHKYSKLHYPTQSSSTHHHIAQPCTAQDRSLSPVPHTISMTAGFCILSPGGEPYIHIDGENTLHFTFPTIILSTSRTSILGFNSTNVCTFSYKH